MHAKRLSTSSTKASSKAIKHRRHVAQGRNTLVTCYCRCLHGSAVVRHEVVRTHETVTNRKSRPSTSRTWWRVAAPLLALLALLRVVVVAGEVEAAKDAARYEDDAHEHHPTGSGDFELKGKSNARDGQNRISTCSEMGGREGSCPTQKGALVRECQAMVWVSRTKWDNCSGQ